MNTNALKIFAQETRRKLMQQVAAKLEFVLTGDSPELRERKEQVKKLKEEIKKTSKEQVVDKVAYTWFNRLVALRFMDANDYQPLGVRVISPLPGQSTAELLNQVKQGDVPKELNTDTQQLLDILDGRTPSSNPQNEVFKAVLIGACNHLNSVLPFLFERINDYTELLLPDDLTSDFSVVSEVVQGMSEEDCSEVEIMGWLYQFYISEKKDEVFAAKKKVKKEDIPAATQLFTPRWIVEYMVQNTVGKLWLQNKPNSKLREHMPYFIDSESVQTDDFLKISSPEEIKVLDQACGSGHILIYAFELLTKIYEEEGYNPSEIAGLIITHNLNGYEVDERAAQLAGMTLLIKAREYQRRFFTKKEVPTPNILQFKDLRLEEEEIESSLAKAKINPSDEMLEDLKNMQQATNLGSLLLPKAEQKEMKSTLQQLKKTATAHDMFFKIQIKELQNAVEQLLILAKKYHCIIDNPPYMGGGSMNKELATFVKKNYPESKADLMACFMEAGLKALEPKGFLGMINQHSWMFLSSYERLREKLIKNTFIDTLLHLGPRTFPEIGGEVVQNAAFTFWNTKKEGKGSYLRLVDEKTTELKRDKTLEAIQNPTCGWFYKADQNDFGLVPSSPIGYWLSDNLLSCFKKGVDLKNIGDTRQGMATSNNARFLKFWFEISKRKSLLQTTSIESSKDSNKKWFPYNKGGSFRKWFGNQEYLVNWENNGEELLELASAKYGSPTRTIKSISEYFKPNLSWSKVSGGDFSVRFYPEGFIFDVAGCCIFFKDNKDINYVQGFLNSNTVKSVLSVLSPTLNYEAGVIAKLPFLNSKSDVDTFVESSIAISKQEWNSRETSWDFQQNELLRIQGQDLEEAFESYCQFWQNKFYTLHKNEEELNKQFIEIYGLQEELTPDVALTDVTLLKDELVQKEVKALSEIFKSGWELVDQKWQLKNEAYNKPKLPFDGKEIMQQFISYAVGCMFGRYSLDKTGLIIANQGETLEDYLKKVYNSDTEPVEVFLPDDDNIIPILDDEWFEDDIVGQFNVFLKASFGEKEFNKNLAFVEEKVGDIRKYLVKSFYADHIKRYKKRPIYWQFSSLKGHFNVLVYMHRYNKDTIHNILNNYLREFIEKLKSQKEQLVEIQISGSATAQTKAKKEEQQIDKMLLDGQEYEREILYKLAIDPVEIDLDDGVLVNYNKFGNALKEVKGLNDKKKKAAVKKFDWIDSDLIK